MSAGQHRQTVDGGPAFPYTIGDHVGMSLRDWFAGQALVALLNTGGHCEASSSDSSGEDASC